MISILQPPLGARTDSHIARNVFQRIQRTSSEVNVLAHVISAASNVVVEQLQPKVLVRSSQRSSHGMGQI
jgi:hypothetical protein